MEQELCQFSMEYALEMVIVFDESGQIVYANESARNHLEYGEKLCGCNIWDIFPGEFRNATAQFDTDYPFGHEIQDMSAYRKNRTCFPCRARMMKWEGHPGTYLCMAFDSSEKDFMEKRAVQADAREKYGSFFDKH